MCLSIPSKIVAIDTQNIATVETMGIMREVSLDLISEVLEIGDYLLIHVGFAMSKIDKEAAIESLKMYQEMLEAMQEEERKALIEDDDNCAKRSRQ